MSDILEKIGLFGLVPVIKVDRVEDAIPLGRALINGGLPVAEITFRTDAAEDAIARLNKELPEILTGAGTVLTVAQAQKAVRAGARFIVSPGFNVPVVEYCIENNIPVTPGINSPTQIEMALERKLNILKFFPAEASGGLPLLRAMAAPYVGVKFIPTGGINKDNLNSYLGFNRVQACGGSWMVKPELISAGKFDEIEKLAKEAVAIMLGYTFGCIRFAESSREKAEESANLLGDLFNFKNTAAGGTIRIGSEIEISAESSPEENHKLAVYTNDLRRAVFYLKRKGLPGGVEIPTGTGNEVFIGKKVSGFGLYLRQK